MLISFYFFTVSTPGIRNLYGVIIMNSHYYYYSFQGYMMNTKISKFNIIFSGKEKKYNSFINLTRVCNMLVVTTG